MRKAYQLLLQVSRRDVGVRTEMVPRPLEGGSILVEEGLWVYTSLSLLYWGTNGEVLTVAGEKATWTRVTTGMEVKFRDVTIRVLGQIDLSYEEI